MTAKIVLVVLAILAASAVAAVALWNWVGAGEAFLGTQIEAVKVGAGSSNHPLLMAAPAGATKGVVYANLHDGEDTQVLLQSVDIVQTR